jgi:hypothetical protein
MDVDEPDLRTDEERVFDAVAVAVLRMANALRARPLRPRAAKRSIKDAVRDVLVLDPGMVLAELAARIDELTEDDAETEIPPPPAWLRLDVPDLSDLLRAVLNEDAAALIGWSESWNGYPGLVVHLLTLIARLAAVKYP